MSTYTPLLAPVYPSRRRLSEIPASTPDIRLFSTPARPLHTPIYPSVPLDTFRYAYMPLGNICTLGFPVHMPPDDPRHPCIWFCPHVSLHASIKPYIPLDKHILYSPTSSKYTDIVCLCTYRRPSHYAAMLNTHPHVPEYYIPLQILIPKPKP